ncbi:MAG: hypothetical protein IJE93_00190 [Clostridia bacterium]|nr:hypothetical protein [Clostridia bacterium]MBQ3160894.1 hypothetical protein [Oscillospiraceae bacterium]
MENIIIRTIPLPSSVRAFTVADESGDYNIYINSLLSFEQQIKSLEHEAVHIENGDFYKEMTATEIERSHKLR